jgi:drug/metabolite transporter (DMT)-like permease
VKPSTRSRASAFSALDWALLAAVAVMWGASFLLIKLSVADFSPTTVAWLRLVFGVVTLGLLPAARTRLRHRRDWWLIGVLGLTWMAVPFLLFPLAEQTIDSALAGMINGAAPLFTAVIALVWFRRRPTSRLLAGLALGFIGVLAVSLPNLRGLASLAGIGLLLLATLMYGVAFNLAEPLEDRNGALAVIWRAQLVAMVASTPTGMLGLRASSPTLEGWIAVAVLGAVSTGLAFACFTILIGRVGAARASVSVYLVPVVAIVLGAWLAAETISPFDLIGIVLVLLGAYLASTATPPLPSSELPVRLEEARGNDPPVVVDARDRGVVR